ncbi:hypothetical protein O181_005537 [Austropuccinia psidii MF-1]|uniref:Uncharacterized protein n=1 Tax=Austropuccinia psidii MF-1 TaxID=1389203 RepID=A0A9Q3GGR9_9BASI|nr:hypothetical protein [Austropuccinia psidii MF-1]
MTDCWPKQWFKARLSRIHFFLGVFHTQTQSNFSPKSLISSDVVPPPQKKITQFKRQLLGPDHLGSIINHAVDLGLGKGEASLEILWLEVRFLGCYLRQFSKLMDLMLDGWIGNLRQHEICNLGNRKTTTPGCDVIELLEIPFLEDGWLASLDSPKELKLDHHIVDSRQWDPTQLSICLIA